VTIQPIDYDKTAAEYARHRQVHPQVLKDLLSTGVVSSVSKVLEVGCGTGNYIVAVASLADCACWGIDPSEQMLSRARERASQVRFRSGKAEALDFSPDLFDLVFSVDVIHHVDDRPTYFREAHRVLRSCGKIIRHRQPLTTYFPETVEPELERYPRIVQLREFMGQAGYGEIVETTVEFPHQLTDIQAYRDKAFSALHLIPQAAFQPFSEELRAWRKT
jgi:ubiquinone/menaquinone biosynthesis C-methylase UbiE